MDDAMAAARAIVHVDFVEKFGFGVYLVLRADYIFDIH